MSLYLRLVSLWYATRSATARRLSGGKGKTRGMNGGEDRREGRAILSLAVSWSYEEYPVFSLSLDLSHLLVLFPIPVI